MVTLASLAYCRPDHFILYETIGVKQIIKTIYQILNHFMLFSDGLLVDPSMAGRMRRMPVGITHSSFRPLDDPFEIEEEFDIMIEKAAAIHDPFEQSFFLLVHIPYLQVFDDINKRTSLIASNIPLLKADLAPIRLRPEDLAGISRE